MLEHIWQRVATKSYLHHPTTRWLGLPNDYIPLSTVCQNRAKISTLKDSSNLKLGYAWHLQKLLAFPFFENIMSGKKKFFSDFIDPSKSLIYHWKKNFPISFLYSMIKLQVSQSTVSQGWDGRLRESWDKPGLATWKLDPHRIQNTTEVMYCQINWASPFI